MRTELISRPPATPPVCPAAPAGDTDRCDQGCHSGDPKIASLQTDVSSLLASVSLLQGGLSTELSSLTAANAALAADKEALQAKVARLTPPAAVPTSILESVPVDSFSGSSYYPDGLRYHYKHSVMSRPNGFGDDCWAPHGFDKQYIQVALPQKYWVSAVETRGRANNAEWVTQFRLLYSNTGVDGPWFPAFSVTGSDVFVGNKENKQVVTNTLKATVSAQYWKLEVVASHGRSSLAWGLLGVPDTLSN